MKPGGVRFDDDKILCLVHQHNTGYLCTESAVLIETQSWIHVFAYPDDMCVATEVGDQLVYAKKRVAVLE